MYLESFHEEKHIKLLWGATLVERLANYLCRIYIILVQNMKHHMLMDFGTSDGKFKRSKVSIGIVPINMGSDFLERSMKLKKLIMKMATPNGKMP